MSWHSKTEPRLTERLAHDVEDLRRQLYSTGAAGTGRNVGVSLGGQGSYLSPLVAAPTVVAPVVATTYRARNVLTVREADYNRIQVPGTNVQVQSGLVSGSPRARSTTPNVKHIDGAHAHGQSLLLGPVRGSTLTLLPNGDIHGLSADLEVEYGLPVQLVYFRSGLGGAGEWFLLNDPSAGIDPDAITTAVDTAIGALPQVDTYSGTGSPTQDNTAQSPRNGSLYYDTDTGAVYRYNNAWILVVNPGGYLSHPPLRAGRHPGAGLTILGRPNPPSYTHNSSRAPLNADDVDNPNQIDLFGVEDATVIARFGRGYTDITFARAAAARRLALSLTYAGYDQDGSAPSPAQRWQSASLVQILEGAQRQTYYQRDSLRIRFPGTNQTFYPFWGSSAAYPAAAIGSPLPPLGLLFKPGTQFWIEAFRDSDTDPWSVTMAKNYVPVRPDNFRSLIFSAANSYTADLDVGDWDLDEILTVGITARGIVRLTNYPDSGELFLRIENDSRNALAAVPSGALNQRTVRLSVVPRNGATPAAREPVSEDLLAQLPAGQQSLGADDYLACRLKRRPARAADGLPQDAVRLLSTKKNDEDLAGPSNVPSAPAIALLHAANPTFISLIWNIPRTLGSTTEVFLPLEYELQWRQHATASSFDDETTNVITVPESEYVSATPTGGGFYRGFGATDVPAITASTRYLFRLRARNARGWSAWSSPLVVTTPAITSPQGPSLLSAISPFSVRAAADSSSRYAVRITWTAPPADSIASYYYQVLLTAPADLDNPVLLGTPDTPVGHTAAGVTYDAAAGTLSILYDGGEPSTTYRARVVVSGRLAGGQYYAVQHGNSAAYTTPALGAPANVVVAPIVGGLRVSGVFESDIVQFIDVCVATTAGAGGANCVRTERVYLPIPVPDPANPLAWSYEFRQIRVGTYYLSFRYGTEGGAFSPWSAQQSADVAQYYLIPHRVDRVDVSAVAGDPNALNPNTEGAIRAKWRDANEYRDQTYEVIMRAALLPTGAPDRLNQNPASLFGTARRPVPGAEQDAADLDARADYYDYTFAGVPAGRYSYSAVRARNLTGASAAVSEADGSSVTVRPAPYVPPPLPVSSQVTLPVRTLRRAITITELMQDVFGQAGINTINADGILCVVNVDTAQGVSQPGIVRGYRSGQNFIAFHLYVLVLLGNTAVNPSSATNNGGVLGTPLARVGPLQSAAPAAGDFGIPPSTATANTDRLLIRESPTVARHANRSRGYGPQRMNASGIPTTSALSRVPAIYSTADPTPANLSAWLGDWVGRCGYHLRQRRLYVRQPPSWYYLQFS